MPESTPSRYEQTAEGQRPLRRAVVYSAIAFTSLIFVMVFFIVSAKPGKTTITSPAAPPAESGYVYIDGNVKVSLADRYLGDAPKRFELPAGQHTLQLVDLKSGRAMNKTVVVFTGQENTYSVHFNE